MRARSSDGALTLLGVSGSHVVMLGWDYPEDKCDGLMGFAIEKTDHFTGRKGWLMGMKTFAATDPGGDLGALHSTREHPIQSFLWSDYSAEPGRRYSYRVIALKGTPAALDPVAETDITLEAEAPEGGVNDVHFNRGIAASQQYARLFGNRKPDENDPDDPAWAWLSRGLFEAMVAFVARAAPGDKLRICAYEFHFVPFLKVLKQAVDRGVDLKIIYDAKDKPRDGMVFPRDANRAAVLAAGLDPALVIERAAMKSAISHNKFMIRYQGDVPTEVWTGGTNFSDGGIYGQSNVGQVVEDAGVAATYAEFWALLAQDLSAEPMRAPIEKMTPTPVGRPAPGVTPMFSPRDSLELLDWYAQQALAAKDALFMTFAFGMDDRFKTAYREGTSRLRFALMERATRSFRTQADREAEEERIKFLRFKVENLFGIGSHLRRDRFGTWLAEKLTGLNSHVRYVHNKFMLIDPLSDDPIVIGGSANFSKASTEKNDENMLIIRGNTRVADLYLCEYMRLYNHHAFRDFLNKSGRARPQLNHLSTGDWWRGHFGDGDKSRRRVYFSHGTFA
ncbi:MULTISPECIES: phospholipase D-like domain-containing protein [unclassified Marinovum]